MLAPSTIAIHSPGPLGYGSIGFSDVNGIVNGGQDCTGAPQRFPHTRAQLSAIARQYNYDSDAEDDTGSRISSAFVSRIVALLVEEHEEQLKSVLKDTYPGMDDDTLEQHVLDLMHKHRDDIAGVPFQFLTPTRRPISRPSSRASNPSGRLTTRPDTPLSAPGSPLAYVFRRPHTPAASPLTQSQTSSWVAAQIQNELPSTSPILAHFQSHLSASLPASPLSSPRLLNAKASEFRPTPRPLSAASSNPASLATLRAETPSPDLWAHNTTRTSSNLAIAAPLTPDLSYVPRAMTPNTGLRSSVRPGEEDEDPFDPFASNGAPRSFHSAPPTHDSVWSPNSNSSDDDVHFPSIQDHYHQRPSANQQTYDSSSNNDSNNSDLDPETAAMLTDGMTPIDVLSSVFGATLAPSELEEALANNGYDFDVAMNWLVDKALPTPSQQPGNPMRMQHMGGRVTLVSRDGNGAGGYGARGNSNKFVSGRSVPGGNRVCRYFLAGECLRADCRFSHDLERALCRFWLRGTCAKGEACEFLHHLPQNIDVNALNVAMARTDLNAPNRQSDASSPPPDDFPTLDHANGMSQFGGKSKRGSAYGHGYQERAYQDPGRTRFSAAVKKAPPSGPRDATLVARREALGPAGEPLHHRTSIVAPRPSPRLKLRPPSLLPTLPTGESVSSLYMGYRSRALQLGAARNACLSRAADAWRRGDGAAAKRFSREGHELNGKMSAEMADAAAQLVKERAKVAEQAAKARDAAWSDDPGDRTSRGKICGGGLGVCLGIASMDISGNDKTTPEERTEAALDLHGLHANEATEVLEQFLLALEIERFYGLAYAIVGEEKHTGTQDPARGASRARLASGVREWLHMWGYPWSERGDGIICIDPLTHA